MADQGGKPFVAGPKHPSQPLTTSPTTSSHRRAWLISSFYHTTLSNLPSQYLDSPRQISILVTKQALRPLDHILERSIVRRHVPKQHILPPIPSHSKIPIRLPILLPPTERDSSDRPASTGCEGDERGIRRGQDDVHVKHVHCSSLSAEISELTKPCHDHTACFFCHGVVEGFDQLRLT